MWDGALSGKEFETAAKEFLRLWNNHESNTYHWSWQECSFSSARGYLTLENVVLSITKNEEEEEEEDDVEDVENSRDAATLTDFTRQPSLCTYHVVYNESYRVPNLFFRGYHSDGRSLEWSDVQMSLLSSPSAQQIGENKWTFLTQEEHPYLLRPWFMLHPCGTGSIMGMIFSERMMNVDRDQVEDENIQSTNFLSSDRNPESAVASVPETSGVQPWNVADQYLLSWMSFVGPVVGLPIPLDLFKSLS